MRTAPIVLVCLLAACFHTPAPGSADRRAIDATAQAWRTTDLPQERSCLVRTEVVRHTDYAEFKKACANPFANAPDPRVLTGCTTTGFSPVPWQANRYTIRIAPGNPHEFTTVQHESCHVLVMCNDLVPNGDALHTDLRIWKAGGPASVEVRANESAPPVSVP